MNSPQPRGSWSELAQPRSWPLPVKLGAVVAVPALFALTLGTLRVLDQSAIADDFDRVDRIAVLQERYSLLTEELQEERDQAVQFVAVRDRQDPAAFEEAAAETDRARSDATRLLGDQSDLSGGSVGALRQVDNNYFRLTQLRRQVLTGANDASDLVTQYGSVIEPLLVFDSAVTRQLSNPEISGLSQAIGALGEAREQVAAQEALVSSVLDGGKLLPPQADAIRAADSRLATATSTVRSVLSDEQQVRYTAFAGSVAATREQLKQSVLDRGRADLPLEVLPQDWTEASTAVLKEMDDAEAGARAELREISAAQQDAASNRAGISSVFLLLAILLGAAIVYLVAKALINSLRTLRAAALDVADRRLPEAVQSMREGGVPDIDVKPVPVTTREEIGQVARAFDAVHSQAVRLAAEQATLQSNVSSMFANLSRRSQALAERQLKLIEQLESNEQDPDQLSNLFQLDSLATRMRRNSENLLVLSGTDLSKRASQPVPVVDVLRAAVSEVEQYQRVVVQSPPDATVAGRAASDIVHLLAELVDNATNFSPPDTQVVMSSQRTSDGSVLIEIVDRGVGMGGDELTDANERLARPTALDVSVSRRMGLFVVGRLAARHGLGVRLGAGPAGTTASVTVPSYLVTAAPGADPGGMAPAGSPRPTPAAQPGEEFVPSPRPGINGLRPAPLSALVAGGDAPAGSPGGPLPGTPTRPSGPEQPAPITLNGRPGPTNGTVPGRNGSGNAPASPSPELDGPDGPPDPGELPTRRPGQMLGQGPTAPPSTGSSKADSGSEPGRGATGEDRTARPQPSRPGSDWSGPFTPPQPGRPAEQPGRPSARPEPGERSGAQQPQQGRPGQQPARPEPVAGELPSQSGQFAVRPQPARPAEQSGSQPPSPQPGRSAGKPSLFAERPQPGRAEQAPGRPSEQSGAQPARTEQPDAHPAQPGRSEVAAPGNEQTRRDAPDHRSQVAPVTEAFPAQKAPTWPAPKWSAAKGAPAQPAQQAQPTGQPAQPAQQAQPTGQPAQPAQQAQPTGQQAQPTGQQAQPGPAPHAARPAETSSPALPVRPAATSFRAVPPASAPAEQAPPSAGPAGPSAPRPTPAPRSDAAAPLFAADTSSPAPARTGNDPSSTTPIFEEIASAWFREDRPVPYEGGADPAQGAPPSQGAQLSVQAAQPGQPAPAAPAAQAAQPAQPAPAAPAAPVAQPAQPAPAAPAAPVAQPVQPAPAAQPALPKRTAAPVPPAGRPLPLPPAPSPAAQAPRAPERTPEPVASTPHSEFASAADDGWRASAAAAELGADELTPAGLPKRRPRARLVPGAASSIAIAPAGAAAGAPVPLPASSARTAEAIRGRLSSYQDGVRQGREMRLRRAAGRDVPSAFTPGSAGPRDEESS